MELRLSTTDGNKTLDSGQVAAIHSDEANRRIVYILTDNSTLIEELPTLSEYTIRVEENYKFYTNK